MGSTSEISQDYTINLQQNTVCYNRIQDVRLSVQKIHMHLRPLLMTVLSLIFSVVNSIYMWGKRHLRVRAPGKEQYLVKRIKVCYSLMYKLL